VRKRLIPRVIAQMPDHCLVASALGQLWVCANSVTKVGEIRPHLFVIFRQSHFRLLGICGCDQNFNQVGAVRVVLFNKKYDCI
jgi:hypothetical protein